MEELLKENMYIIDLGNVNTAPDIIFELSSVLDKDEAKNKRICLKLGNVTLNQAQLLSIKSLISGIDSTLSCLDTKSIETEKVALSLGIIISNVSAENALEVTPEMPYKTAEELREEMQNMQEAEAQPVETQTQEAVEADNYVEERQEAPKENEVHETVAEIEQQQESNIEAVVENENTTAEEHITEENNNQQADFVQNETQEEVQNEVDTTENVNVNENINEAAQAEIEREEPAPKEEIQDELDVIFGTDPVKSSIFEMTPPVEEQYEQREELADIVVPEQEYTKEDIELEEFPTKYIKQTIRSGQVINYEGNIVIIGDCHPGSEITALGDITVWGILSGIAHAGSGGNQKARVRALKMNAIQLRIANCYSRRPDSLNTVYIEKTNSFEPEEARIVNSEIVVFKIND